MHWQEDGRAAGTARREVKEANGRYRGWAWRLLPFRRACGEGRGEADPCPREGAAGLT